MFSLYRSWLGGVYPVHVPEPGPALPDVVVAVGEPRHAHAHQFTAHRAVLAANSGYFKAALGPDASPAACVAVSGVTAEAFAPLLGYMYTGYLDIGSDNIYDVLLATHYLHMPRALELCRNFLRAHPPAAALDAALDGGARSTLVKPIPGLPWRPALLGPGPPQPPQPPAPHMVLPTAEHSPFRAPFLGPSGPATAALPPRTASPDITPPLKRRREDAAGQQQLGQPAVKRICHATPPEAAAHSAPAATAASEPSSPDAGRQSPTAPASADPAHAPASTPSSSSTSSTTSKVVIDVACCDGPVRFHRVLNESYGREDDDDHQDGDHEHGEQPADENQQRAHEHGHGPGVAQLRRARAAATAGTVATEYRCLYCNHTFKSHYCYQKHARRHLNPLTPKLDQGSDAGTVGHGGRASSSGPAPRAPARPLDMNVQYYPCKTCGSKFPSYYFVHKHRKMCHSAEEGDTAAGAKPANEHL